MTNYNSDLSQQAWDDALTAHKVPRHLTDEQVALQFPAVVVAALKGLIGLYANKVRKENGQAPIPMYKVRVPPSVHEWLSDQINSIDAATGKVGSNAYRNLASGLLGELRGLERAFLGHHD